MIRVPVSGAGFALVDEADFDLVSRHRWNAVKLHRRVYAQTKVRDPETGRRRSVYMHRLVAEPPAGHVVDHINHSTLDNRRENLRVCTVQQNAWNQRKTREGTSSRFKGVCDDGFRGWKAHIRVGGKRLFLGGFRTEEEAARAYDAAAREHHGEFASLNFPEAT